MFQAQYLFALKQQERTHEMPNGMQVVLVVPKTQSLYLIRHLLIRWHCYCYIIIRKYQLMLKLLAGEDFLKWLKLVCTLCDAILVAWKKTNVTVRENQIQDHHLGE